MYERRTLVAALAATTLVASATAALPPSLGDGFYQGEEIARESECERGRERGWWNDENPITPLLSSPGRATFFGASKQLHDSFEKIRGRVRTATCTTAHVATLTSRR